MAERLRDSCKCSVNSLKEYMDKTQPQCSDLASACFVFRNVYSVSFI